MGLSPAQQRGDSDGPRVPRRRDERPAGRPVRDPARRGVRLRRGGTGRRRAGEAGVPGPHRTAADHGGARQGAARAAGVPAGRAIRGTDRGRDRRARSRLHRRQHRVRAGTAGKPAEVVAQGRARRQLEPQGERGPLQRGRHVVHQRRADRRSRRTAAQDERGGRRHPRVRPGRARRGLAARPHRAWLRRDADRRDERAGRRHGGADQAVTADGAQGR